MSRKKKGKGGDDITRNKHGGNENSNIAHERTDKSRDCTRIALLLSQYPDGTGLNSEEAGHILRMPRQTCSARFSDMKKLGWIVPTGESRLTQQDCPAAVMQLLRLSPDIDPLLPPPVPVPPPGKPPLQANGVLIKPKKPPL